MANYYEGIWLLLVKWCSFQFYNCDQYQVTWRENSYKHCQSARGKCSIFEVVCVRALTQSREYIEALIYQWVLHGFFSNWRQPFPISGVNFLMKKVSDDLTRVPHAVEEKLRDSWFRRCFRGECRIPSIHLIVLQNFPWTLNCLSKTKHLRSD